ncbi:MAG TPA: PQ-loop repeat-containing protein [Myxococcota bacterium]|jgi:lipid-A-disaccharide synthase-like uncharacterized protein
MLFSLLGTLGMVAIEASYLPQIVRLARRKRSADVSILFPALNACGRMLAVVYAVHEGQSVFVAGFVVGIALRLVLLSQVVWYRVGPVSSEVTS